MDLFLHEATLVYTQLTKQQCQSKDLAISQASRLLTGSRFDSFSMNTRDKDYDAKKLVVKGLLEVASDEADPDAASKARWALYLGRKFVDLVIAKEGYFSFLSRATACRLATESYHSTDRQFGRGEATSYCISLCVTRFKARCTTVRTQRVKNAPSK